MPKPKPVGPKTLSGDAQRAYLAAQKSQMTEPGKTPAKPCGYVYYPNPAREARDASPASESGDKEKPLPPTSPVTPASRKRKKATDPQTPASKIRRVMGLSSPGSITHGTFSSPHAMMKEGSSRSLGRAFKLGAPNGITVSVFGQLITPYQEPEAIELIWDDGQLRECAHFLTSEPTYTTPTIKITYKEISANRGKLRIGSQNSVMRTRLGKEAASVKDYLNILGLANTCNIPAWGHALCYTFHPEHPANPENLTAVLDIANKAEAMISEALKRAMETAHKDDEPVAHWTLTVTNHRQEVLNTEDELLGYLENLCRKQVYTYTYYDAEGKLINTITLTLDPLDPNIPSCKDLTDKLKELFLMVMRQEDLFQIDTSMDVDSEEPASPPVKLAPRKLFRSPQEDTDQKLRAKKPRMKSSGFFDHSVVTPADPIHHPLASPAVASPAVASPALPRALRAKPMSVRT